jgi:DNA ligase (NAD+)
MGTIEELQRHRQLYYNGTPEITDAEYDALEQELIAAGVDISEVGAPPSGLFDDVGHDIPMLSLDKANTPEELAAFLNRHSDQVFALWPKFDGVSISLRYRQGRFSQAITRGDGFTGEDVTPNIAPFVPESLPEAVDVEVRGEMVMLKSKFAEIKDEYGFVNPRNAASGTIRLKEHDPKRELSFMPFDLVGQFDGAVNERLAELGFTPTGYGEATSQEEIETYIASAEADRDSFDYEIDGVVIKIADRAHYESLGVTSHHPRGAVAYKLAAEIQETTLEEVIWQVGKTGKVTPVGMVAPVFVAGTTISRVTLHNQAVIAEQDLRIGDRIKIKRAGDVIPKVVEALVDQRQGAETPIAIPTECPSCDSELVAIGDSEILECQNSSCQAQDIRRVIHWAGRSAADIDAIGEKWIVTLAEAGILNRPSDFYRLSAEQLLEFDRVGEKLATRMIDSIETSKDIGMRRALIGFSIPLASEGTAKRLGLAGYQSVEEVAAATPEQLVEVEDIGPLVAESLVEFFSRPETTQEISDLRDLGVNLDIHDQDRPVTGNNLPLAGKKICITGTLSVSRSEFKTLLEQAGAKTSSSVSANTDYLVAGEKAGSKRTKAEDLGVEILTEEQARTLVS